MAISKKHLNLSLWELLIHSRSILFQVQAVGVEANENRLGVIPESGEPAELRDGEPAESWADVVRGNRNVSM